MTDSAYGNDKSWKLIGKEASNAQHTYFCPYCGRELIYLWDENERHLLGCGTEKHLYCVHSKKMFVMQTSGISETSLNCIVVIK